MLRAAASLVCLHVGARTCTVVQGTGTRRGECASQVGHALCGCKDDGNSFTMTCYNNGTITGDRAPRTPLRCATFWSICCLLPDTCTLFHRRGRTRCCDILDRCHVCFDWHPDWCVWRIPSWWVLWRSRQSRGLRCQPVRWQVDMRAQRRHQHVQRWR